MREGQAVAGVVIPAGFARRAVLLAVQASGDRTVLARPAHSAGDRRRQQHDRREDRQAAAEGRILEYTRRHGSCGPSAAARVLRSPVHIDPRSTPILNSRLFTIPAQMGFIIYQVTLAVASLAFARERELGTLEQLLVTPLRRIELIGGKAMLAWLRRCSWTF